MTVETLKELYRQMLRIRQVEEAIAGRYSKQQMRCPVHLSIGQEAVPVGICAHLSSADRVYSNHRCHAHYLAKGGSLPKMIAELHGKVTGCVKGKGGSMHLVDAEKGMMGASALVAGTIPMAVGSALALSMSQTSNVSITFFGDGAVDEGILYESLNFAAIKNLPVIFACENNNYATYSHKKTRHGGSSICARANAFGVVAYQVDGNDVEAVHQGAGEAVHRAREGNGPTFIEFMTYRWRDHVGPGFDFEIGYRSKEEVESWMAKCPIKRIQKKLIAEGHLTESEVKIIHQSITQEVEDAFIFADQSELPPPSEIFTDIYA